MYSSFYSGLMRILSCSLQDLWGKNEVPGLDHSLCRAVNSRGLFISLEEVVLGGDGV